eukprot:GEZU01007856.1.p1 GENE.GEZU01007856.1~~GEZU01007856.1.p1  ORF type:complete len:106 (+),score=26.35 GEZU01007856.1:201-518(+)
MNQNMEGLKKDLPPGTHIKGEEKQDPKNLKVESYGNKKEAKERSFKKHHLEMPGDFASDDTGRTASDRSQLNNEAAMLFSGEPVVDQVTHHTRQQRDQRTEGSTK